MFYLCQWFVSFTIPSLNFDFDFNFDMLHVTLGSALKGQLQREHKLLSYKRALKMLKNDIRITVIGQAILEIFYFKVDIPRKSQRIILEFLLRSA